MNSFWTRRILPGFGVISTPKNGGDYVVITKNGKIQVIVKRIANKPPILVLFEGLLKVQKIEAYATKWKECIRE